MLSLGQKVLAVASLLFVQAITLVFGGILGIILLPLTIVVAIYLFEM